MDSYEFEVAAKNAVIKKLEELKVYVAIEDLQLVWFSHTLRNKKCMLYAPEMDDLYAEVTYSNNSMMMFVDIYKKTAHECVSFKDFDTVVHKA